MGHARAFVRMSNSVFILRLFESPYQTRIAIMPQYATATTTTTETTTTTATATPTATPTPTATTTATTPQ